MEASRPSSPRPRVLESEGRPAAEPHAEKLEHLDRVRFDIEVALSDWGVAQSADIVDAIHTDADCYVPVHVVLESPLLNDKNITVDDVLLALPSGSSSYVEVPTSDIPPVRHAKPCSARQLIRSLAAEISSQRESHRVASRSMGKHDVLHRAPDTLGHPTCGANSRGIKECIPSLPGQKTSPSALRDMLSDLFETSVQTVRLPPLYDRDAPARPRGTSEFASLYEQHPGWDQLSKEAKRALRMPEDGGPFKNYAFIVIADRQAGERILKDWQPGGSGTDPMTRSASQQRKVAGPVNGCHEGESDDTASSGEADREPEMSLVERARKEGLHVMTLEHWNRLRSDYLAYRRALEKLDEEYEERDWRDRERRADRDQRTRYSSRRRDEDFWSYSGRSRHREPDEDDDEALPRPSDQDHWGHRSPSPVAPEDAAARIPGTLVHLRNIASSTRTVSLKRALNALLSAATEAEGVQHVDVARASTRATIRCSNAGAASRLVEIFAGDPRTHASPDAEDEDAFEVLGPMDEVPSVRAAVLNESEASAYWAELTRFDRADGRGRPDVSHRKRQDRFEKPQSKHTRFD